MKCHIGNIISLTQNATYHFRFSSDQDFAKHVAGMLVESGTQSTNELKGKYLQVCDFSSMYKYCSFESMK